MDRPTITYARRPDATPEAELTALAAVYRIVLRSKKEAAPESRPDDAEGPKNDRTATEILPKPS